jgi:IMP cyclohydrolase
VNRNINIIDTTYTHYVGFSYIYVCIIYTGKLERPSVAFNAHHVADVNLDEANERIVFDTVITNEGSGYDSSTGIFTAPVGGMYQFTVHICTDTSKYSYIGIVHADNIFAKKYQYASGNPYCSSVGGVIRVNSGEQVWVQSTSSASNRQLNDSSGSSRMNIFYGMLINS